jgi:hypothetical protein
MVVVVVVVVVCKSSSPFPTPIDCAGPVEVAARLYREQGLSGFYKGIAAYFVLCLRPAVQFAVFERLKAARLGSKGGVALGALDAFVLGAVARAVATVVVYPYTRAKVLAQVSVRRTRPAAPASDADGAAAAVPEDDDDVTAVRAPQPPVPPVTVPAVLQAILEEEGVRGLFRGLGPEVFRGMLSGAVMLMVKEKIDAAARISLRGNAAKPTTNAPVRSTF